jgi:hypothetical protein
MEEAFYAYGANADEEHQVNDYDIHVIVDVMNKYTIDRVKQLSIQDAGLQIRYMKFWRNPMWALKHTRTYPDTIANQHPDKREVYLGSEDLLPLSNPRSIKNTERLMKMVHDEQAGMLQQIDPLATQNVHYQHYYQS